MANLTTEQRTKLWGEWNFSAKDLADFLDRKAGKILNASNKVFLANGNTVEFQRIAGKLTGLAMQLDSLIESLDEIQEAIEVASLPPAPALPSEEIESDVIVAE